MRDGNKSRCVKYETRLVLYAPLVMAIAVLIALMRKSTEETVSMGPFQQYDRKRPWNSQLLPLRIMPSNTATKFEITWSTWSRPARTVMTSELGLVYFFFKTQARKTIKVYVTPQRLQDKAMDSMNIRTSSAYESTGLAPEAASRIARIKSCWVWT